MNKAAPSRKLNSFFRWWSLRTKIIAWSFVPTAIILVAVALITFYAYQQVTEDLLLEQETALIHLSAGQLASELTGYADRLAAEARLAGSVEMHPALQRVVLQRARERLVIFDGGVAILDAFGRVVAVEPREPELLGQNWSDRGYFARLKLSPKPVFSDIIPAGPEDEPAIVVAVPITGSQGQFLGAMVGQFRLGSGSRSGFYGGITGLGLAEEGSLYLVDGNGQVIYHSSTLGDFGQDFSGRVALYLSVIGQTGGAIRTRDLAGQEIVAGSAPVPGTSWQLVSEARWATLTSDSRGYQRFLLVLVGLGVAIPAALVFIGVRRIVQPVEALIKATQEVAVGNFGQTISAQTGDEIEELAQQFNLMSVQLQESYATLEQRVADRTRELAILNAISASVNASLDLPDTLDRILDETLDLLKFEVGEIRLIDEASDELVLRTERGLSLEFVQETHRQKVSELLPQPNILSGEPVIEEDLLAHKRWPLARQEGLRAMAIFPLRAKERLLGTLCLATRRGPRSLTRNEQELIRAISDQASVAIENAELYAETNQRVDEIETLLTVSQAIASRLDVDAVLQIIADEARRLTSSRGAFVFLLEDESLRLAVLSSEGQADVQVGYRISLSGSLTEWVLQQGRPLRLDDARQEPRADPGLVQRLEIRSLMIVPLLSGSEPIGSISVINKSPGLFEPNDQRVLTILASGAVIGLENARLYHQEQERRYEAEQRRRVAEGLRDILTVLNSNRPLDEILDYIAAQAGRLLGTDTVAIYRLHEAEELLKIQAARGLPPDYIAKMAVPVGQGVVGRAAATRRPVAVSDFSLDQVKSYLVSQGPRQTFLAYLRGRYQALLAVPLIVRDEVYGGIVLYYPEKREFSTEEIDLAVSFANQGALAIENARLFVQAEQAAMLEERQRLARDLHDSVTQSLYGVTMFTEAAARLLESDQKGLAADYLRQVRQTAQEALQEMRLLLFELRPPILEEEGLLTALQARLEAVEGRTGLETEFDTVEVPELPPKIEEGLYRIAQEALNNVLKHAQARRVILHLKQTGPHLVLEIIDDGVGFDPIAVRGQGGFGLPGMEERVAQMGGQLIIDSQPDSGTTVRVELVLEDKQGEVERV